jgi:predicted HTH domain antitoxin
MEQSDVVRLYELGKISQSKAAEICCVSRSEFLRIPGEHKVSVIQYDEDSLDRELALKGRSSSVEKKVLGF